MKLRKKELIVFGILLAAAIIAAAALYVVQSRKDYGSITIYAYDQTMGPYSLGKDQEIVIETILGRNVCTIKDGQAYMSDADCPDQKCVHGFPPLTGHGDTLGWIICLPHQVMIEVTPAEGEASGTVDGVT